MTEEELELLTKDHDRCTFYLRSGVILFGAPNYPITDGLICIDVTAVNGVGVCFADEVHDTTVLVDDIVAVSFRRRVYQ